MDVKTVVNATGEIIVDNARKVYLISQTCGGWEIWLQCELAFLFDSAAQREVDVWEDGRACDLYFSENGFIVELKCLGWNAIQLSKKKKGSFGATNSALEAFNLRILEDQQKIAEYKGSGVSLAVIPKFVKEDYNSSKGLLMTAGYAFIDITDDFGLAHWSK